MRHRNYDRIVDDLVENLPRKAIAHLRKTNLKTVGNIAKARTRVIVERLFDAGEDQLTFFKFWNTGPKNPKRW